MNPGGGGEFLNDKPISLDGRWRFQRSLVLLVTIRQFYIESGKLLISKSSVAFSPLSLLSWKVSRRAVMVSFPIIEVTLVR